MADGRRVVAWIGVSATVAVHLVLLAPTLPRTIDDAWISYRYAANLADGLGLVWADGPPAVEGYSNLTWTLLVAAGLALGVPVTTWVGGWSTALSAGVIGATAGCVRAAGGGRTAAVGAALLVATSTFVRPWFATGLETPLMALLITTATWQTIAHRPALAAALWGLVAVTRPEGALYLLVPAAAWIAGSRTDLRRGLLLAALLLAPLLAQFAFRAETYGTLFANSGAAKLAWAGDPLRVGGWRYLLAAATCDPLLTLVLAAGAALVARSAGRLLVLPLAPAATFVLIANGDTFSELRLLAPVVPCAIAGALVGLDAWVRGRALPAVFVALSVAAVAGAETWAMKVDRNATPAGFGLTTLQRLAPPWVTVRWRHQGGPRHREILRWPEVDRGQLDWFIRLLIERLPRGGTFVFEDIGLVGYLVLDGRLLDARGLTWPEAARLVTADLPPDLPLADVPVVAEFRRAFFHEDPVLVFLTCPVEGFRSPVERVLLDEPDFTARWTLAARGPYLSGLGRVCMYERSFVAASAEVGAARYRRLEAELPDRHEWAALRAELEAGTAADPANAWRVAPDGTPLHPELAEEESGKSRRQRNRTRRASRPDDAPGDEARARRRRERGLPE